MRLHRAVTGLAALAIVTGACASSGAPQWTFAPPSPVAAAASPLAGVDQPAPGSPGMAHTASTGTLSFEIYDLGFTPNEATVPAAGTYEVTLKNTGSTLHDITFADGTTIQAKPG